MSPETNGLLPNIDEIRERDFPQLIESGRIYLDTTATSQEPWSVVKRMCRYRRSHVRGSNHSSHSAEAREAHEAFDSARAKVTDFFGAHNFTTGFTSGVTDTSNYIASRFPFKSGDLLVLTDMEHNSQILTARNFAKNAGAKVKYAPIDNSGRLDLERLENIIRSQTRGKILLNLIHVSNVTGVENNVREIRELLGERGFIYLDMAQSAGHMPINLDELDVDFAGVSSHKLYGPMGIGNIFINNRSKRYVGNSVSGGSAIEMVSRWFTAKAGEPARFEPGTQDIEGAIEFGYTLDYLKQIGMGRIAAHEHALGERFFYGIRDTEGIHILGPQDYAAKAAAVISFTIGNTMKKTYDEVAKALDTKGISVRDGCFCSHIYTARLLGMPSIVHEVRTALMRGGVSKTMLKLPGAVRASFGFYNTLEESEKAISAVKEVAGEH